MTYSLMATINPPKVRLRSAVPEKMPTTHSKDDFDDDAHARSFATQFRGIVGAALLSRFKAEVEVSKDDEVSDGKSNLGLMMLAAMEGDTIRVRIKGEDAPAAMNAIADLFDRSFDEE